MVNWVSRNNVVQRVITSQLVRASFIVSLLLFLHIIVPPSTFAANDQCSGERQGCNNNKVCVKKNGNDHRTCEQCSRNAQCNTGEKCINYNCKPDPGNSTTNPDGTTQTTSGSDESTNASSDPSPARIGDEDCEIDGVANAGVKTEIGICLPKEPAGFAAAFYRVGVGLIGGLSLIFLIIGAYIMMTSQGNPLRLQNGKTYIFYAVFGLLLAIFGYVFIEVIAVDILQIPDFAH